MPTGKSVWRSFTEGMWVAGPAENVPGGALRRALNIHVQRGQGSMMSRSGSVDYVAARAGLCHTLGQLGGTRVCGIAQTFYTIDPATGALTLAPSVWQSGGANPSGTLTDRRWSFMELPVQLLSTNPNIAADLAAVSSGGAAAYQFIANAGTAWKFDGINGSYWGIDAPTAALVQGLTVTATTPPINTQIASFDGAYANNATDTAAGPSGFAAAVDTARKVEGTGSRRLDCMRDAETINTFSYASGSYTPVDLTLGGTSTDEDYIQCWIHVARPANVKSINLKFFVQASGTFSAAAFNQDPNATAGNTAPYGSYYHIELTVQAVKSKKKRKLIGLGDFVPFDPENRAMKRFLRHHPPDKGPDLEALDFINPTTLAVSRNTWSKVTIPKGLFEAAGSAGIPGLTWANVVGFQFSCETNKSGNTSVWIDDLRVVGGVGTRGDYLYTITYRNDRTGARSNPPYVKAADGTITLATSPTVTLDRQACAVGNFPATLNASHFRGGAPGSGGIVDNQVTHIEIWRTVGNGNPGKPHAPFNAPTSLQMFLVDKIAVGTTTYTDSTADYPGMHSLSGAKFLNSDQEMQFDNMPPWTANETIAGPQLSTITQAVYHPPTGRVFFTDSAHPTRVFITPPGRPESLADFIEPTGPSDPIQRLVIWNDNLYILTEKGIQQLEGSDVPFFAQPIAGVAGTYYPYTVRATPYGIVSVAQDGLRIFDGQTSQLAANDALGPIFRGSTTIETIPGFKNNAVDGHTYGAMASWGRDELLLTDCLNTVFAYNPALDAWRVINIPNVLTLFHETSQATVGGQLQNIGVILAGIRTGTNVSGICYFDGNASGEVSGVPGEATPDASLVTGGLLDTVTSAVFVSGENQGIVMMLYMELHTAAQNLIVSVLLDGTELVLDSAVNTSSKQRREFNINKVANIAQVRLRSAAPLTSRIEVSSLELQAYESAGE
jgi:hypothetical protein